LRYLFDVVDVAFHGLLYPFCPTHRFYR
jgi:hypothetical protein